jgi:Bifunctional DNA primase/polymerase, N-terminal
MTGVGEAALAYAAAGYRVFPLRGKLPLGNCPACEPRGPRYRPHQAPECGHELCHGLYAATSDPVRVEHWWARWPQANIGARVPTSLLVIDVDPRHGGLGRLAELEREHGPLPPTRVSVSGRGDGGHHRWFLHPGGHVTAARLGAGVDLKTHAGYVVLPPSRHPATGQPYRWAEPTLAPAALPAAWWRLLAPAPLRPAPATRRPSIPAPGRGGRAAEAFNQATSWTQVLGPHGCSCPDPDPDADGARWRHPGATNPKCATIRYGLLFVYSAATPFQPTEAGAPRGYSRSSGAAIGRPRSGSCQVPTGEPYRTSVRNEEGILLTATPVNRSGPHRGGVHKAARWGPSLRSTTPTMLAGVNGVPDDQIGLAQADCCRFAARGGRFVGGRSRTGPLTWGGAEGI